jgi:uncharacterized protein (DUF4415 family)
LSSAFVATIESEDARIAMTGFRSHGQALGRPLGLSRLGVQMRFEVRESLKEAADPAVAPDKGGRPKAEGPKVHIGFRLSADVVESVRASGPGYNVRVEEALRAAGFGAAKKTVAKRAAPAKKRVTMTGAT